MADVFKINDVDAATLGVVFLEGVYDELTKFPEVKDTLANDWADEHGTERDVTARKFKSRNIALRVLIMGSSKADMLTKKQALLSLLLGGYFELKAYGLNRAFTLIYTGANGYRDYGDFCEVTLQVEDDYPHIVAPLHDEGSGGEEEDEPNDEPNDEGNNEGEV